LPVQNCCIITKASGGSDKSCKMEGDYHRQRWTAWFLLKHGVKLSHIHCWLSAVCGEKRHAHSSVFSWVWSFSSGEETKQFVIREQYHDTRNKWFCGAIQKLPKRWQQCIDLGGEYVELAVVSIQPKNNKRSCKWDESKSFLNAPHIIDLCTVVDFQLTDFGVCNKHRTGLCDEYPCIFSSAKSWTCEPQPQKQCWIFRTHSETLTVGCESRSCSKSYVVCFR